MNLPRLTLLLLALLAFQAAAVEEDKWIQDPTDPLVRTCTDNASGFTVELQAASPNLSCDLVWSRIYGGQDDEYVTSFSQTEDGGFILAGSTQFRGSGSIKLWLLRTDSNGTELWNRTFEGQGEAVSESKDGGFIIAGSRSPAGGSAGAEDILLIKTDSRGEEIWNRTFFNKYPDESHESDSYRYTPIEFSSKEFGSQGSTGTSVLETVDGDIILLANVKPSGVRLIKTSSSGEDIWTKSLSEAEGDEAYSITPADDGGYLLAGCSEPSGSLDKDLWLVKVNSSGDELWSRTYHRSRDDVGYSVDQTRDGGYIIAGSTESDAWLIKTDSSGLEQWDKTYSDKDWSRGLRGTSIMGFEGTKGLSAQQTEDGGFILTGHSWGEFSAWVGGSGSDVRELMCEAYVLKVDPVGNREWTLILSRSDDRAYAIKETQKGEFVILGATRPSLADSSFTKEYREWRDSGKDTGDFLGPIFEEDTRGWDAWMMSIVCT